jgi:hypothetical protein
LELKAMADLKPCSTDLCNTGSSYWALTQMCGQDKIWKGPPKNPDRHVMLVTDTGDFCYCTCTTNPYCYNRNCIPNMVQVMHQCTIMQKGYQSFVVMPAFTGQDPADCQCPCPHVACGFCDDPTVKEYVAESCKTSYWWPGYPMVLSGGGGQFCTCLCPVSSSKILAVAVPHQEVRAIEQIGQNDLVMAAGLDLIWSARPVRARTESQTIIPIPAVTIMHGDDGITLAADQLVLAADGKLRPAHDLQAGETLRHADGGVIVLDEVSAFTHDKVAPPFLALHLSAPDQTLDARFLNINGFVVSDYSLQLFATLGQVDRTLIRLMAD